MVRLILYLIVVAILAAAFAWLADRPGTLMLFWQGYKAEVTLFEAVILFVTFLGLILLVWSILGQAWRSPTVLGRFLSKRRQKRGLDALSSGMIAVGAGDRAMATHYAMQARKSLPNEPLTHLLRAQAAQLSGDRITARRIFEAMLATPDTEQLGLRGLFVEAEREGETEAARQFAERALRLNAKLAWPVEALFEIQCREANWAGALETLALARRAHNVSQLSGDRRKAVLLAAQAQTLEDGDPDGALTLALEAHRLAPELVPAAVIAGRLLASRGNTPRATRIIARTWVRSPHPDLAIVYAHARVGDSPRDRLERVKRLVALAPNTIEGPVAVATQAIEARAFDDARRVLEPLVPGRLTQRVCLLMARLEGEQHGDTGRVREWLARAVNAPRDPAWTADGVVAEDWAPVSPVTGALDAFQWRVPVEAVDREGASRAADKIDDLVSLGVAPCKPEPAIVPATPVPAPVVADALPRAAARDSAVLVPHVERRVAADTPAPILSAPVDAGHGKIEKADIPDGNVPIALPSRVDEAVDKATADIQGEVVPAGDRRPPPAASAGKNSNRGNDGYDWLDGVELGPTWGGPHVGARPAPPVLTPPRAPDDPGPDPGDFEDDRFRPGLMRTS